MPLTLTAESTEFVTLNEVKAQANVTGSNHDVELQLIRGAAQDVVEGIVGPVLWLTVTESVRVSVNGVGLLSYRPVVSLSAPATGLTLTRDAGLITSDPYIGTPLVVTYIAGRTVVPDAIRLATLIVASHLWDTQRGVSPAQFDPSSDLGPVTPMGFAIPNRAVELLRPFALGPSVA